MKGICSYLHEFPHAGARFGEEKYNGREMRNGKTNNHGIRGEPEEDVKEGVKRKGSGTLPCTASWRCKQAPAETSRAATKVAIEGIKQGKAA